MPKHVDGRSITYGGKPALVTHNNFSHHITYRRWGNVNRGSWRWNHYGWWWCGIISCFFGAAAHRKAADHGKQGYYAQSAEFMLSHHLNFN
jgi:hypothetical protein